MSVLLLDGSSTCFPPESGLCSGGGSNPASHCPFDIGQKPVQCELKWGHQLLAHRPRAAIRWANGSQSLLMWAEVEPYCLKGSIVFGWDWKLSSIRCTLFIRKTLAQFLFSGAKFQASLVVWFVEVSYYLAFETQPWDILNRRVLKLAFTYTIMCLKK